MDIWYCSILLTYRIEYFSSNSLTIGSYGDSIHQCMNLVCHGSQVFTFFFLLVPVSPALIQSFYNFFQDARVPLSKV